VTKTTTTGKNGNGKSGSVRDQLALQDVTDIIDASVLCLFFVQKIGKASASDVSDKLEDIGGSINEHLLDQALEALRGRGLLSYARGAKTSGEKVQMYKTTKVKWAAPPEVAHIKDLLPALVKTEEATRIINILNGKEEIGDGEKKAKRKLGYAEFFDISTTFRLRTPIIGSQPDSPYLRKIIKSSKIKAPIECKLRFWRDEETGAAIIPSDVVCGWLRSFMRVFFNKADSAAAYIAADDVHLMPKEIYQVELPIIDEQTKKGLGLGTYEVISKGTELTIDFRVPARGIADPLSFVMALAAYAPNPTRGISPARGRRFGKMEMIDYKIHGLSTKPEHSLGAVIDKLESDDAKKLYAKLFAEATQNKVDFTKVDKGGVKAADIN
jgi:hypothetical protein